MKRIKLLILFLLISNFIFSAAAKTTSSTQDGSWSNGSTWDNGVPNGGKDNITISDSDSVNAVSIGTITIGSSAALIVESGAILVVQNIIFSNGSSILVESGGQLIVLNDLTNNNNSDDVVIDGEIKVSGTLDNGNGADISGEGIIESEEYTGSCCIMGIDPDDLVPGDIIQDSVIVGNLPIELLSFEAHCLKDKVLLEWETATEINNDYFTIYKSHNGIDWVEMEFINAVGNSNENERYEFYDYDIEFDFICYYKLKQVDFDGQSETFDIIYVSCVKHSKQYFIYPNPVPAGQGFLIDGLDGTEEIQVFDMLGGKCNRETLSPGAYLIYIDDSCFKIIVF